MSQNNSDNARYHTAEANLEHAQQKVRQLERKLDKLSVKLNEILEVSSLVGATQLTMSVIIKHKVEQAHDVINE